MIVHGTPTKIIKITSDLVHYESTITNNPDAYNANSRKRITKNGERILSQEGSVSHIQKTIKLEL